jgi:hypothetical protein
MTSRTKLDRDSTESGKPQLIRKDIFAATETSEEYQRFVDAVRTILSVPKGEVDREMKSRRMDKVQAVSYPS